MRNFVSLTMTALILTVLTLGACGQLSFQQSTDSSRGAVTVVNSGQAGTYTIQLSAEVVTDTVTDAEGNVTAARQYLLHWSDSQATPEAQITYTVYVNSAAAAETTGVSWAFAPVAAGNYTIRVESVLGAKSNLLVISHVEG